MITAEQQRDRLQAMAAAGRNLQADQPRWLGDARAQARQSLNELALVDRKQEAWRYTSVEGLFAQAFMPAANTALSTPLDLDANLIPDLVAHRLVFVDGRYQSALSDLDQLPTGVRLGSLRAALSSDPGSLRTWFTQAARQEEHVFTALNTALINDGVMIHVGPDVVLDRPIEVIYLNRAEADPLLIPTRNVVVLDAGAEATLVERCLGLHGTAATYFHNQLTEISLGEGAVLFHDRQQDEHRDAYHLSSLHLTQQARSRYQGTTMAIGSAWSRTEYRARFQQPGAQCRLNGLYTVGDRQLQDVHLDILHAVPGCLSDARFKGVLYGKGRGVLDGRILVDRQAQQSDAHLSNDNLLLTHGAEIDAKPQLEIYADDVKCSHGTSVGQLDPQQVFYLRSRGLDEAAARKILCLGFAGDILDALAVPTLAKHVAARLDHILNAALAS